MPCTRLASSKGFRVLEVRPAVTPSTIPALGVVLVPTLPPEALRPLARRPTATSTSSGCGRTASRSRSIAAAGRGPGVDRAGAGRHRPGPGAAAQRRPDGHGARDPAPALPRAGCSPASGTACRTGWAQVGARAGLAPDPAARARRGAAAACSTGTRSPCRVATSPSTGCASTGRRSPAPRCSSAAPARAPSSSPAGGRRHPDRLGRSEAELPTRWRRRAGLGRARRRRMPVVTHLMAATGPGPSSASRTSCAWDRSDGAPAEASPATRTWRMPCAGLARIGATSVVFQPDRGRARPRGVRGVRRA